jgi:hypothetical protein
MDKKARVKTTGKIRNLAPILFDEELVKQAEEAYEEQRRQKRYYKTSGNRWHQLDEGMPSGARARLFG